jgi:hypothetical protein
MPEENVGPESGEAIDTDANPEGVLPFTSDPSTDDPDAGNDPAAEPLNTEPSEPAEPEPKQEPFHNHPRFQELQSKIQEGEAQRAEMQAQFEEMQRQNKFLNQMVSDYQENRIPPPVPPQQQGMQQRQFPPQQGQPGQQMQPNQGLEPWPEEPMAMDEFGPFMDNRISSHVEQANQRSMQAYHEAAVQPMMEQVSRTIGVIQSMMLDQMCPDHKEVMESVNKELFAYDQDGNIIGEKNPQLIKYFKSQPFPAHAAYQYGKSRPGVIKKQTQKQTKEALKQVAQRPKGPTQPKAGSVKQDAPDLDWNSDPLGSSTEAYLEKHGLL